jgi:hypothetical protein
MLNSNSQSSPVRSKSPPHPGNAGLDKILPSVNHVTHLDRFLEYFDQNHGCLRECGFQQRLGHPRFDPWRDRDGCEMFPCEPSTAQAERDCRLRESPKGAIVVSKHAKNRETSVCSAEQDGHIHSAPVKALLSLIRNGGFRGSANVTRAVLNATCHLSVQFKQVRRPYASQNTVRGPELQGVNSHDVR